MPRYNKNRFCYNKKSVTTNIRMVSIKIFSFKLYEYIVKEVVTRE